MSANISPTHAFIGPKLYFSALLLSTLFLSLPVNPFSYNISRFNPIANSQLHEGDPVYADNISFLDLVSSFTEFKIQCLFNTTTAVAISWYLKEELGIDGQPEISNNSTINGYGSNATSVVISYNTIINNIVMSWKYDHHLWNSDMMLSNFTNEAPNASVCTDGLAFLLSPHFRPIHIPHTNNRKFLGLINSMKHHTMFRNQGVDWGLFNQQIGTSQIINALPLYASWKATKVTFSSMIENLHASSMLEQNQNFTRYSFAYHDDWFDSLDKLAMVKFLCCTGQNVLQNTSHIEQYPFNFGVYTMSGKTTWWECALLWIFLLIMGIGLGCLIVLKIQKNKTKIAVNAAIEGELMFNKFSYQELASATDNFSCERVLGQGGSSCVYKGVLHDSGHLVAIKRIFKGYKYAKEVFTSELKILSSLECRNIVSLIGWSDDQGEFLLVYDYMLNRSLDMHLFGNKTYLSWSVRCNIALGLASALLYLHEESGQCILHRDIKSANVMLDLNFNAKLGDFGVAMFLVPQVSPETTKIVGTLGYIAPEYIRQGKVSKESDIYSFGIVALEIASGRKKHKDEDSHLSLVEWIWELYGAGKILDAADERLNMDLDEREMECLLIVGLWCAHPVDKQRPTARQAMQVLQFEAPLPELPRELPSLNMYSTATTPPADSNQPSITSSLEIGR